MKRRVLSLLLGTAMVASMLAGCGGSGDAAATDSTAAEGSKDAAEFSERSRAISLSCSSLLASAFAG